MVAFVPSLPRQHSITQLLLLLAVTMLTWAAAASSPPSCEASLSGTNYPPFEMGPQIVGCLSSGCTVLNIPGSSSYNPAYAPDSIINATNIPYCEAQCVNPHASSEQVNSLALSCKSFCSSHPAGAGTLENYGWCLYWCVAGHQDAISALSCSGVLAYHYQTITQDSQVETVPILGTGYITFPGDDNTPTATPVGEPHTSGESLTAFAGSSSSSGLGSGSGSASRTGSSVMATSASDASAQAAGGATGSSQSGGAVSTSKSGAGRTELLGGSLAALLVGALMRII